ncbi:MAG: hypothetical protein JST33_02090 [Actinobacteria bacterium]|nr:hypothetical protein [Actinomycetota bacterium]
MPRSHRRREERPREDSLDRLIAGWKRTEMRGTTQWHVQPLTAAQALKEYVCPGCRGTIPVGTAHVVVWRADGVLGDAADLAGRRHWHSTCWKRG